MALALAPAAPAAPVFGMRPRQELAVRRFTQYCRGQWGTMLFHKVGTGKTITSLLIALNSMTQAELDDANVKIIIVAPTDAIFTNFTNDYADKLPAWARYAGKLVSYPYPQLIQDINMKNLPPRARADRNFEDSIVIFDEAHRLLGKEIFNSREAGSRVERHPILEDIYFVNKINKAKKCIIMTGTPIQVDTADICRLLNFITKSKNFTKEIYAPITIEATAKQQAMVWITNFLKGAGAVAATKIVEEAGRIAGEQVPQGAQNAASTAAPYLAALVAMAAMAYIAYGVQQKKESELQAKRQRGTLLAQVRSGGGTRKKHKGGGFFNFLGFAAKTAADPFKAMAEDPSKMVMPLFGPGAAGKGAAESVVKLGIDMMIAGFQDYTEKLYNNIWNVKKLAEDASPYISVYDPDIQINLKGSPYTPGLLWRLRKQAKEGAEKYAASGKGEDFQLKEEYRAFFKSDEPKFDMPEKMIHYEEITYNDKQHALLYRMFSGEMGYEISSLFNLDRYEPVNPDVKAKYKFMREYARMIGNYSDDFLKYYTVINAAGTDYELFNRATGRPVAVDGRTPLFSCEKFEVCLNYLLHMRTTGTMIDPTLPDLPQIDMERAKAELTRIVSGEVSTAELSALTKKKYIPQPHNEGVNQYLPLIYSYTEDYGLGPFCIYLKSRGFQYILAHTNQDANTFQGIYTQVREQRFAPYTAQTKATSPLCCLLHPTMTEGYDFKYNPAIFVVEPCNTFGDQEQVYGRVLRSYSPADINITKRKYPDPANAKPEKKLIVQFQCATKSDMGIMTKMKLLMLKGKFWESRYVPTPQALIQQFTKAKIISPDLYSTDYLMREGRNLKNFEQYILGGKDFSDLSFSALCLATQVGTANCDPLTVGSCGDAPPARKYDLGAAIAPANAAAFAAEVAAYDADPRGVELNESAKSETNRIEREVQEYENLLNPLYHGTYGNEEEANANYNGGRRRTRKNKRT